jgi:uncharacterized membrane protein
MDYQVTFDADTESRKRWLWWLYLGHGASVVFSLGMLSFIPLIINYLKKGETEGSLLYTHHQWQIRSFWWYVVWFSVACLIAFTIIGIPLAMLIWAGAWIWKAYRLTRGFIYLSDNKPMPVPSAPAQDH